MFRRKLWQKTLSPLYLAQKKQKKRAPPRGSWALATKTQGKNTRPPEDRGKKKQMKLKFMGAYYEFQNHYTHKKFFGELFFAITRTLITQKNSPGIILRNRVRNQISGLRGLSGVSSQGLFG